jgi:hypothetical protein
MYDWIDGYFPAIKGFCPYDCCYCYVKCVRHRFKQNPHPDIKLDEKVLRRRPVSGKHIFAFHTIDFLAPGVPDEYIRASMERIFEIEKSNYAGGLEPNTWYFQTRNLRRIGKFWEYFYTNIPKSSGKEMYKRHFYIGTSFETNEYPAIISKSPLPVMRCHALESLPLDNKYLALEPIIKFNHKVFVKMIVDVNPKFVVIGAESKGNRLVRSMEPSMTDIQNLTRALAEAGIEIRLKSNLKRLIGIYGFGLIHGSLKED